MSVTAARGTIRLINAVFYAHHGVMKEEHRVGGRFEVDVEADVDFAEAAKHDDLSKTVDYERVYGDVQRIITQNKFYLIERLAYLIARQVLESSTMTRRVAVTVRKSNPPVGGPCDCAEATFEISRNDEPG